ncbi:MAG: carboxypeptidase regulatory-like domain-containing protein [Bryobacter sp.]|nr:carboxypeptidase regulatory-like domain-containing protein [Bryobacter sp.]
MKKTLQLFACAIALATSLFAQANGRISGSVTDASGAAVPGATVELFLANGQNALSTTSTKEDGGFFFAGIAGGKYDISISSQGFRKEIIRGLDVSSNLELSLKPTKLEISQTSETIEVSAEAATVQTSSTEISSTVTNQQLRSLPSLNRSPVGLLLTQAGVTSNARTNTTINGLRPSFSNITLDGINIQDNFIRTNTLDFQPNLLLLDQVAEATIVTSNSNPALGNGAAQINFSTPSGTNKYRGSLIWLNRNNVASANTWFNNFSGVRRPFLNQNQFGGTIGGPIVKDKLLFYANYEGLRLRQQSAATRTILTPEARSGVFSYRTAGGIQRVNVLNAANLTPDSVTRQLIDQVPAAGNRPDIGDGINTTGIGFNIRNNRTRDNVLGKVDYYLNQKNHIFGTYTWNRDIVDRPDLMNNYATVPTVQNNSKARLMSLTYRWNPSPTFTNEARGGFNLTDAPFDTTEDFTSPIIAPTLIGNPRNTFRAQGRFTDTYNLQNNSTWTKGKHTIQFGYQSQWIRVNSYNEGAITPIYNVGISAANNINILGALPGSSAADQTLANNLLALQAGFLTTANQTFNVADRTSGFVPNQRQERNFTSDNYALYFQDKWRTTRNLTLNIGLRWDYFTPVDESNGLALLPVYGNRSPIDVLLDPNGTLDFAGKAVNRPWYKKDYNNFAPNIGLAWDPSGEGKTSIRAGYSVNFANDEFIRSVDNNTATNAGLAQGVNLTNLTSRASAPPAIPTPTFQVPRTFAQNFAASPTSAFGVPDPTLVTPYVQQWSLGVQRELGSGILEVRYVGNRGTKQFRAFDYNQIDFNLPPGYRQDFLNALNNGLLAQARTGLFRPAFNSAIPGSVPLPFFDQLPSRGLLTNATIIGLIQRQEIAELGSTYQANRLNGPFSWYQNRNAQGTNMMTNYSNASYHGLQIDYTRRFQKGLYFQANYVWSRNLSDANGDAQARFEPFLDINNNAIEYSRTLFDLNHQFKMNSSYELPVGKGKMLDAGNWFNQLIGGWTVSGFLTVNSGSPFTITSGRGTFNRGARSGNNTATSLLTVEQINSLVGVRTGNGVNFFAPNVTGADGRAVAPDGRAPFSGQIFFHPGATQIGSLGRRIFNGPMFWNLDMALQKAFNFGERRSAEFRAEAFNVSNSVSFNVVDQNINSTTFGRITGTQSGRRIVQFSLRLVF